MPVSLNLFLHCLSLPLPSKSGFPALLSLLLCILPGKAIHITYEPGWQALGADASSSSSSSSRQVTNLWERVGTHLPLMLAAFQFQLPFMLISIFFFLSFCFFHLFFHLVALKLLLVPGEQSPWHRGDVLESRLCQLFSLMFFVLLSLVLFFPFSSFYWACRSCPVSQVGALPNDPSGI